MKALGEGSFTPEQGVDEAARCLQTSGDGCWALPLALAYWQQKRYKECCDLLEQQHIFQACSHSFLYFNLLGMSVKHLKDGEYRAKEAYEKAIEIDPNRPDTLYNLANLVKEDDQQRADRLYLKSLNLNNWASQCWHNYGSNLTDLHRQENAIQALKISINLDPSIADVWCNLGLAYYGLERFDEAERCFRFSLSMDTTHAQSHINLGNTLINVFRPEEAVTLLERGLELDPSSHNSLWNLALAYLLLGRFKLGWKYYESRFKACKEFENVIPPTRGPQLKTIDHLPRAGEAELVVWSEQGMGDSIQFIRYLYLLKSLGVPFLYVARDSLLSLFLNWTDFSDQIVSPDDMDDENDQRYHVPLMSLPMIFNTDERTIPAYAPYLSSSEPTPTHLEIHQPAGGISVGLVWASNPDNKAMYRNKSMPVDLLMPCLNRAMKLGLLEIHCLQFGDDSQQIKPWLHEESVFNWTDRLRDFSDTAHIIRQLDLVVCVDTAVAHLAGAMNRPTWLLLPYNADFRWLRARSDSPWYPSMRLLGKLPVMIGHQ